jgi:molecular chaperone GrpE (heat shock protein)
MTKKPFPSASASTVSSVATSSQTSSELQELEARLTAVTEECALAQEGERRARADYANLMRRTQEDRVRMAKLAAREVITALFEPLAHLDLATQQLNDRGLQMATGQLYAALQSQVLTE